MTKKQASAEYGIGPLSFSNILKDNHRVRWAPGDWTDDTDQFCFDSENDLRFTHLLFSLIPGQSC